jgi:hypothetical protein
MMLSRSIDDRSGRHHSRRFVTSNAAARNAAFDSKLRVASILSPTLQPTTSPFRLDLTLATNQSPKPRRATILHSHTAAKSP